MRQTILVVEDTPIVREPLARLLRTEGYEALCAGNGVEALVALKGRPVDLVLLDVMMPKMNGVAFVEGVRANDRWKRLPIIAITGVMDSTWLARLGQLGVDTVVPKGRFTFDGLMNDIHRILGPTPTAVLA
jgi:CheY-like chemotaxis protein